MCRKQSVRKKWKTECVESLQTLGYFEVVS